MKIVVVDKPHENDGEIQWERLNKFGETKVYADTKQEDIAETIGDAEVVFINKGKITKEIIDACPNLKYISVMATGYNKIDVDYAKEKNIVVTNVPSYGSKAIAQHAVALLLEITNRVAYNDGEVRKLRKTNDNDWSFWDYPIIELEYKTIGIIGLGRIGQTVAKFALAMGMNVIAYDKYQDKNLIALGIEYVSKEELFSKSDVISMHCALSAETEKIINKESIKTMKDGVIIINNSRGGLVDEQALSNALHSGKVGAAGLDVVEKEPIEKDNPLLSAPNCFITPHISWAALDCRKRLIEYAINNLEKYLEGNPVNVVNK